MTIRLTATERAVIREEGTHLGDDGTYWLYFADGWRDTETDCSALHGSTKGNVYQELRDKMKSGYICVEVANG